MKKGKFYFVEDKAQAAKIRVQKGQKCTRFMTSTRFEVMRNTEAVRLQVTGRKTGPAPTLLQINKYLVRNLLPKIKIVDNEKNENPGPAGSTSTGRL